jgi:hypothetical protein
MLGSMTITYQYSTRASALGIIRSKFSTWLGTIAPHGFKGKDCPQSIIFDTIIQGSLNKLKDGISFVAFMGRGISNSYFHILRLV